MSQTLKLQQPARPEDLFCPFHWQHLAATRMWAVIWVGRAILEDRRFIAALGLKAGSKPTRAQVAKALAEQPACCRLGRRADHLMSYAHKEAG